MEAVQTELLIDEVKKREAIWNISSETYKDRVLRKNQWLELCSIFCPDFEDQTPKEKAATCKDLQSKWRSIRDAYVRYLRTKKSKFGQGSKNMKSYIYANNLEFLNKSVYPCLTESSLTEEDIEIQEERIEEDFTNDSLSQVDEIELESSSSTRYRKRKAGQRKPENYIDITIKHEEPSEENKSDDIDFFKSILPMMNVMPMHEKIKFRRDVLNTLVGYIQPPQMPFIPPFLPSTPSPLLACQNHYQNFPSCSLW